MGACLEEEVARLWDSGVSAGEIASRMGVEESWVESLISMWETGEVGEPEVSEEPEPKTGISRDRGRGAL